MSLPVDLLWALVGAVLATAGGLGVPRLIASLDEPAPEPAPEPPDAPGDDPAEDRPPPPAKEPYVVIAARPGLAVRCAVVSGVVGALVGAVVGAEQPAHLVVVLPLVPIAVALSVVDLRTRLLPKQIVAPSYALVVVAVLVAAAVSQDWADLRRAGLGWLAMGGFYALTWLIAGSRLVGYGDVRLSGVLGIALGSLGWGALLIGMYAAFLVNLVPPLVALARRGGRVALRAKYPFGPAMVVGALIGVLVGEPLWQGYLDAIAPG